MIFIKIFSILFFSCNFITPIKTQEILVFNNTLSYYEILQFMQTVLEKLPANECVYQLQEWAQSLSKGELWAWKMLDAMAKPQSGILLGNIMHIGNYDECLEINVNIKRRHIEGKYCSAIFQPDPVNGENFNQLLTNLMQDFRRNNESNSITEDARMTYGFCVPKICSTQDLQDVMNLITESSKFPVNFYFNDKFCESNEKPEFTNSAILGIAIFSVFAIILFCATLYEILIDVEDPAKLKTLAKLLLAFSAINNTKKILSTKTTSDSLNCLNGLRVISMMWIVLAHGFQFTFFVPHVNAQQILEWRNKTENAFVIASAMAVDTFFTISGLLVVYLFMISQKRGVKFNLPVFYLHRILRLTPALAMLVLLTTTLLVYMGRGPFWPVVEEMFQKSCKDYWWSSIIYLQNYINPDEQCVGHSWYLAVDTQMYFLSPLILFPLIRWPKPLISAIITFIVLNSCYVFEITFKKHLGTTFLNQDSEQFRLLYSPTHVRGTAYLIGMLCGYFVYKTKTQQIILTKLQIFLSWLCSLSVLTAIVIAHSTMISAIEYPVLESSFFNALTRNGWSIALSIIILLCINGYGGLINTFLSCNIFNVLIKLNYSIYLVHINILVLLLAQGRTATYFSNLLGFHHFWGDYIFSVGAAFIWTLAFESPIIGIERIYFSTRKVIPTFQPPNKEEIFKDIKTNQYIVNVEHEKNENSANTS